MLQIRKTILLSGFVVLLIISHEISAKTLVQELNEVDKLRAGFNTPFDEVEKRCNELLERYTKPEEQAKIYYQLAVVYSQSGQIMPNKTIEFSKKALELPLGPIEQLQLYVWWGDAIQVAHRGVRNQELVVARRKAVIPYLNGLKESLHLQYPRDTQPEHPPEEQNVIADSRDPFGPARQRIRAERKKALDDWKQARFERDLNQHRKALTGQISYMYSSFPWASDEIRELATKILGDQAAVERLMSHVDEAVQKRVKELEWEPGPPDISPPATVTKKSPSKLKGVFIPVADKALKQDKPFVFDLKNATLLNPAAKIGSAQAHEKLLKLGKGDIAWDGSLVTVRKAKALTVSQESHRPLKCTLGRWCNWNRLPDKVDLPYSVLVVTKEDVDYLICILEIKADGIKITYKKLSAEEALGRALFDAKYSDPRKFIRLKWHSGMPYKTARRLIKEDKLPLLYEMLEDKSYAPYWHKVARLIGYISDDPCSVPVLLQYFQRDDSWNWKSVDRTTGIPRLMGKISALAWIGKNRAGIADIILRQAVTEKSAEKLAADWIGDNLVQGSSTFKSKENVVALIRNSAAKGLVYSGKRENIEIVKKLYAQEDAYCRTNRKTSTLHNGLVEAMAIEDFIREKSLESLLNTFGASNHLDIMIPYLTKYSWLLQDLEKKRKTEID